ncbi:hypothetical protein XENOCAPTIV_002634, partial [Xenoophorus captivus]
DIAKNSLLRWPVFLYWTCLGVFDAVIFFFGAYFLFDNTTFTSNGQVSFCICPPFLNYQRMYYVFMQMLSSGPAWLSIILLIIVSLLPDVIKKVLCRAVCPTATERAQVHEKLLSGSVAELAPLSFRQSYKGRNTNSTLLHLGAAETLSLHSSSPLPQKLLAHLSEGGRSDLSSLSPYMLRLSGAGFAYYAPGPETPV